MKTIIEITVGLNGNCKDCDYATKIPVPYLNSFAARWKCSLFDEFITDVIIASIETYCEKPDQCGLCRQLIERHNRTPER